MRAAAPLHLSATLSDSAMAQAAGYAGCTWLNDRPVDEVKVRRRSPAAAAAAAAAVCLPLKPSFLFFLFPSPVHHLPSCSATPWVAEQA